MKTLKMMLMVLMIMFLTSSLVRSQTYQFEYHQEFDESDQMLGWCLNHMLKGFWTYHVIYHLDPKTGALVFTHVNVLDYDLTDLTTGDKLKYVDTGNDRLGLSWEWLKINMGVPITLPDDGDWPTEGSNIWAHFTYKSVKGKYSFSIHEVFQVHQNASGETIVDNYKAQYNCNE